MGTPKRPSNRPRNHPKNSPDFWAVFGVSRDPPNRRFQDPKKGRFWGVPFLRFRNPFLETSRLSCVALPGPPFFYTGSILNCNQKKAVFSFPDEIQGFWPKMPEMAFQSSQNSEKTPQFSETFLGHFRIPISGFQVFLKNISTDANFLKNALNLPGKSGPEISQKFAGFDIFADSAKLPGCSRKFLENFFRLLKTFRSPLKPFSGSSKHRETKKKSKKAKMPIPYQRLIKTTPPPSAQGASGPCHSKKCTFCTTVTFSGLPRGSKKGVFFDLFF